MSRPKKLNEVLHCRIEKQLADKLVEHSVQTGLTKTATVERALRLYFEHYKKTGKI